MRGYLFSHHNPSTFDDALGNLSRSEGRSWCCWSTVLLEYSVASSSSPSSPATSSSEINLGKIRSTVLPHNFAAQHKFFYPPPSLADLKDVESSKIVPSESGLSKKRGRNGDNWGPSKLTGNLMGRSSILRIELRPNTVRHGF